jgi:hypothetical protein
MRTPQCEAFFLFSLALGQSYGTRPRAVQLLAEPLPSRYLGLSGNSPCACLSQTKRGVCQALTQEISSQNGRQIA